MKRQMIEVGKIMQWHARVSNYGHIAVYRVRVKKIRKRVTVDVLNKDGAVSRMTVVRPEHLHDDPAQST